PRAVAESLAGRVVGAVPGPLAAHPPAARSRRLTRAVVPPAGLAVLAAATGQPRAAYAFAGLAVLAVPLGLDRYRQLGHVTDGERLSVRSGSLRRRQAVVEHTAIVGWRIRRTLFQRRLGLATLVAAAGAGEGGYSAIDMAEEDAVALAAAITPAWLTPFLESPPDACRLLRAAGAEPDLGPGRHGGALALGLAASRGSLRRGLGARGGRGGAGGGLVLRGGHRGTGGRLLLRGRPGGLPRRGPLRRG